MGRTKMVDKIKKRYYWPNQFVFVEQQVYQLDCLSFKIMSTAYVYLWL